MKLPQRFEVKPKTAKNVVLLTILCGFFVLLGFFIMATGVGIFVGLLVILFFGGGGLFAIPKLARRSVSMILTSDGLHQVSPYGDVVILWQDVESIGISNVFSNKMVGLRLKTYDRYVNNLPPQLAEHMTKYLPYLKFLLLPQASNVAEKVGSVATKTSLFKDERFGRFANDFKEIEDILEEAVRKVDPSKVSSEVFHNINFCDRKGMMPKDLCDSLHKVRQIRNDLIHEDLTMPNAIHFELLKKCKQEVMTVFKQ